MDIRKIIFHRLTPAYGPSGVISWIIKQKFDEPWPSWKKVQLEVGPLSEAKYQSHFLSKRVHAFSKYRNGHDCATWIPPNVRTILDEHWGSIAKENQAIDKRASTYCCGFISTLVHYKKWLYNFNGCQVLER
ncbi:hypothetical protein CR513_53270, partial [Mucuna pruriens]